jgi:hypothetical protein
VNDSITSHIRQLREDLGNAQECEDDTVEVPIVALDVILAEHDRLTIEVDHLRARLIEIRDQIPFDDQDEFPVAADIRRLVNDAL